MADEAIDTKPLTGKEKKFVDEYCKDCNASRAARDAGYSVNTCAIIGFENLRKPKIRTAIDEKLKEMSLSAQETTKLIVDIAKASINPYIRVSKREKTPQIRVGLQVAINKLIEEIEFEEEYSTLAGYSDEEMQSHKGRQAGRQREVIRLRLRLKKYPNATTLIEGEPIIEEYADLDLVAISKDKEAGRIKTWKNTEHGVQVELYPADAALRDVARMQGLFAKDNAQLQPQISVTVTKEEAREIAAALNSDV